MSLYTPDSWSLQSPKALKCLYKQKNLPKCCVVKSGVLSAKNQLFIFLLWVSA